MNNKYDIELEMRKNTPASIILGGIKKNSKVLEFGCGNGRMTQWMKESLDCDVTILEQDLELYQKAVVFAENGICGNIEDAEWMKILKQHSFDYIIYADVLEHLHNPEEILRLSAKMLKEDGSVWISVPNIAHNDILMKLYNNSLNYTDTGILDRTHVHHFTYKNLCTLISEAGFDIIYENCISCPTGCSEQCLNDEPVMTDFLRVLDERELGEVYQYVFRIVPKGKGTNRESHIRNNCDILERRVFFDQGQGYSEENQKVFYGKKSDHGLWIRTEVPALTKVIRFDPVLKCPCKIDKLNICSNKGVLDIAECNGSWEGSSLIFKNFFPVLYVTDLDQVEWISISGEISYDYNLIEKSNAVRLEDTFVQMQKLDDEKKELEKIICAYREEQNKLSEEIQKYEIKRQQTDAQILQLTDILENEKKQEQELRAYQAELLEVCDNLRKSEEEKNHIIHIKEVENQEARGQVSILIQENEKLKVQLDAEKEERNLYDQMIVGKEKESEYLKEQIETWKSSLNDVNIQMKEKNEQILDLEKENRYLFAQNDVKIRENERLNEKVEQRERENLNLAGKVKQMQKENDDLSVKLRQILTSNEELLKKIDRAVEENHGLVIKAEENCREKEALVQRLKEADEKLAQYVKISEERFAQYVKTSDEKLAQHVKAADERLAQHIKSADEKLAYVNLHVKQLKTEKNDLEYRCREIMEVSQLRDDNISHLQRVIQDKDYELLAKQNFIDYLKRQIDEYRFSTSWRLTEPLRYLGRLIRKENTTQLLSLETKIQEAEIIEQGEAEAAATVWAENEWQWDIHQENYYPLVTVIVPNFNHAPYLEERLESIYGQTYKNIEVILLDDFSSDNSREILQKYADIYADKTRTIFNEKNCGHIFDQWNRGIEAARGEVIWIAESDDYCELNFLEKLIPLLARESVMLAFARSVFMTDGKETWNTEQYLADLQELSWDHPFTMTAHDIVRKGFSIKNIIPNVSSAVFRNTGKVEDTVKNLCSSMRLSGDWIFYLSVIRGGCISYTNETTNYYRIHVKSTSLKVQQDMDYYREYEAVSCYVNQNYIVPDENFRKIKHNLKEHYKAIHHTASGDLVDEYYSVEKIIEQKTKREPNVVMVCFSLQPGGGEVYGLYLANEMKRQGIAVTLLDLRMGTTELAIKDKLNKKVPLVSLESMDHTYHVLKQLGAEIIHTHHGSADMAIAGWLQGGMLPVKQIITLHGMYEMMPEEIFANTINTVNPVCSKYIYIADKNLDPFKRANVYQECSFVKLPNGLPEISGEVVERSSLGIKKKDFVLVLASRGIAEKGWKEAVDAVKIANVTSKKKIHLLILGDGEIRAELEKEAPEYIHFMGVQNNVRGYFAMGDAGIVPTRFKGESYPLVIIECLQSGKPVIATDIAEVRNQLTDEHGNLAGALLKLENWQLDTKQIANILVSIANDENYYMKLKKRCKSAAKKFDMTNIAKEYLNIYRTVLGDKE